MNAVKTKKIVRLAFVLFNLGCIGGIVELYLAIFPGLNALFSVFTVNLSHVGEINDTLAAVPVWPVILMVGTIALYLCLAAYAYKLVISRIQAQNSK